MADSSLLLNLTAALGVALVLGLLAKRVGLSPLVGYLLAGIVLGPSTPGYVADAETAAQLSQIGIVLLMFGVGLSFQLRDLLAVRWLAVPGAVVLGGVTVASAAAVLWWMGLPWGVSLVLGLCLPLSSTVVLTRVLLERQMLGTVPGHIAVGWTVVEDLIGISIIIVLPAITAGAQAGELVPFELAGTLAIAFVKAAVLAVLVFAAGRWVIPVLLGHVVRTRSRELFTLAVLVLALAVATASSLFFGVSVALGAFLAGLAVGQSDASHQAAADALPLRDAFAVLFFVSVGMLFNPAILLDQPAALLALAAVLLVWKPIVATLVIVFAKHSARTGATIGMALAQIGEFSFILADQAMGGGLIPPEGRSLIVALAILSIAVNPLLLEGTERVFSRGSRRFSDHPGIGLFRRPRAAPAQPPPLVVPAAPDRVGAIVVGYGPVGQSIVRILEDFGVEPIIVELNLDTVRALGRSGRRAIFGDAGNGEILRAAGLERARYLLVTLPDLEGRLPVLAAARSVNPGVRILVRARYLKERAWLEEMGATGVAYEEAEAAVGLAALLLNDIGAEPARIEEEARRIRVELALRQAPVPKAQRESDT